MTTYLDTSALVKIVVDEEHSGALRRYLQPEDQLVSSALCRTELLRSMAGQPSSVVRQAEALLGSLQLMPLTDSLLDAAGRLRVAQLPFLRSLDALHLVSAQRLPDVRLVSYDRRMAAAAEPLSIATVCPR